MRSNAELPPSRWAHYAINLPWPVAKEGNVIKSNLIRNLHTLELQRELVLRPSIQWGRHHFDVKIGLERKWVEASLVFITGDAASPSCMTCQQGHGPFPICIRSREPGSPDACANCIWLGPNAHCSLEFPGLASTTRSASSHLPSLALSAPDVRRALRQRVAGLAAQYDNMVVIMANPNTTPQQMINELNHLMEELRDHLHSIR